MSVPTTGREWHFPTIGHYKNLERRQTNIRPPKASEVLVKVHAVSLQYRDLTISLGKYRVPPIPDLIPCSDMAGEIIAVGEDVTGWKIGDRVCANFSLDHVAGDLTPEIAKTAQGGATHGVLTEYKHYKPHSLVKIPDHLSYEEASTLPCAALTAYNAFNGPKPLKGGDTVLIEGTGGVSIFGLQMAVACGATVIATSSSDKKLEIAKKLGAKHLINYNTTPNWDDKVLEITNGRGVDHILEVGGAGTLEKSMKCVRMAGWIHIIGLLSSADPVNVIPYAIGRVIHLRGILIGSVDQFQDMNRLLETHPETTRPVIDKVFSFDDVKEAYAHLESQKHVGKIVIKVA